MNQTKRIYQIGAAGAGLSTLLLIAMLFVSLPHDMFYPGLDVLTGKLVLSGAEQVQYLNGMYLLYVLDSLFLLGWLLSWVALAELVRSRLPLFGILTLIIGVAGALLDFSENSITWGVLFHYASGFPVTADWAVAWKAVQHLSYWLPFIGAVFAACGLWSRNGLDRLVALCGTVLIIPAAMGMYFPALFMLSNVWFFLWFLLLTILLWRRAAELGDREEIS